MVFRTFCSGRHTTGPSCTPNLGSEDDLKQVVQTHEELAQCVPNDPEASACEYDTSDPVGAAFAPARTSTSRGDGAGPGGSTAGRSPLAIELAGDDPLARARHSPARLPRFRTALDEVLAATIHLLGANMGTVQLFDPESNSLKIICQSGFPEEFLDRFAHGQGRRRPACQDGPQERGRSSSRTCRRIRRDHMQRRPLAASAGYRALLLIPLLDLNRDLLGALSTTWRNRSAFETRAADCGPLCKAGGQMSLLSTSPRQRPPT